MTSYSWSYKHDLAPTIANPHGGNKKRKVELPPTVEDPAHLTLHPQNHAIETVQPMQKTFLNPEARLFVGGLPQHCDDFEVGEFFSCYGPVADLRVLRESDTGLCKGYGFVTYHSVSVAKKARNLCRISYPTIRGKKIYVDYAERREKQDPTIIEREDPESTILWEYRWGPLPPDAKVAGEATEEEKKEFEEQQKALKDKEENKTEEKKEKPVGLVNDYDDSDDDDDTTQKTKGKEEKKENNFPVCMDASEPLPERPAGPPPQIHGPYTTRQMIAWQDQGFFDNNIVHIREEGEAEWIPIEDIDLSMLP
eukprot:m.8571 g.8571  ORF g.8571 m.8571 type:complete len:309 (+) comp3924_c0_seq1:77-1003(+)